MKWVAHEYEVARLPFVGHGGQSNGALDAGGGNDGAALSSEIADQAAR